MGLMGSILGLMGDILGVIWELMLMGMYMTGAWGTEEGAGVFGEVFLRGWARFEALWTANILAILAARTMEEILTARRMRPMIQSPTKKKREREKADPFLWVWLGSTSKGAGFTSKEGMVDGFKSKEGMVDGFKSNEGMVDGFTSKEGTDVGFRSRVGTEGFKLSNPWCPWCILSEEGRWRDMAEGKTSPFPRESWPSSWEMEAPIKTT